jgi:signal transduction histidine kinase
MTDGLCAALRAVVLAAAPALLMATMAVMANAAQAADPPPLPLVHYTQAELAVAPLPEGDTLAELLAMTNTQRPPADAAWTTVKLPDLKARQAIATLPADANGKMRWYRLRYLRPGPAPDESSPPLGLYIPRVVSGPLSVLLRMGPADKPQWRVLYQSNERWREEWNRPVLVELPPEAGPDVEVVVGCSGIVERSLHVLSTMWMGPLDTLLWRANWRRLLQLQAPMATSVAILIVGLFALGVWWRRRHERAYLYFALAAGVWSFRNLHYYIDLPRDTALWTWFWWATHASLSWVMLLVYAFALRFDDRRHVAVERTLVAVVLLCSLVSLPVLPRHFDVLLVQHLANVLVSIIVTVYMSVLCWRGGGPELRAITLASWVSLAFGVNDLQLLAGRMDPETLYLLPYSPLVVFGSFLYATLRRYLQAIERVEGANEQLEARLRQREAELEANHVRLREVEREQAVLRERERLMADMHDGIGSTLMSSLIMLEQGQMDRDAVAGVVRECVDDLRLVIDSLEPIDNDLGTLLATLRYRLGRRMEAAGVRLEWTMDDLPRLHWLAPPDALQLLRLLQEVLTNVLKHAGAERVHLSARVTEAAALELRVQDDGCGFDTQSAAHSGGRGLSNLRLRARKLRAVLEMDSAPGRGTIVRLTLPLQREASS